jgi:hypothetical protein
MSHWNLKRAARLGYLAGGGLSVESIMADHVIAVVRGGSRSTRCLIPASGYYEWQDTAEGKQPYYFATSTTPEKAVGLQ